MEACDNVVMVTSLYLFKLNTDSNQEKLSLLVFLPVLHLTLQSTILLLNVVPTGQGSATFTSKRAIFEKKKKKIRPKPQNIVELYNEGNLNWSINIITNVSK